MNKLSVVSSLIKLAKLLINNELNEDVVIEFLSENQNPTDKKLHEWANNNKYDVEKVEEIVYRLATKFANFSKNGKANEVGITKKDVDEKELKIGIEVEKEHTPDLDVAERIALDHLAEMKDYYTKLKVMEGD